MWHTIIIIIILMDNFNLLHVAHFNPADFKFFSGFNHFRLKRAQYFVQNNIICVAIHNMRKCVENVKSENFGSN